jgi:hypothetical protein
MTSTLSFVPTSSIALSPKREEYLIFDDLIYSLPICPATTFRIAAES